MNKIKVMTDDLANKIAAGEVIEKIVNVVKELVENSIDAESTKIEISLKDSGVKEIIVKDNGIGMSKEDAEVSFERHATSKLTSVSDLFNITSLGFRGEALPSIASVSKTTLKTSDGKTGTEVIINGGKDKKVNSTDLKKGTIVKVENLFYNTPVRLKYLKNLYTELANIVDYVDKIALANPEISFTLKNNDKVLLSTDGSGNLEKVIYEIYGLDVAKKIMAIVNENDDYSISGYISFPEVAKSNRSAITTIVNGRVIKDNELNKIIVDTYHTFIPKDKFPICVINITVDPMLIDCNVHPTKMDIKFSKIDELKDLIEKTITDSLNSINLIPDAPVRDKDISRESVIPLQKAFKKEEDLDPIIEKTYEEVKLELDEYHDEVEEKPTIKKMIARGCAHLTYIYAENEDGIFIIDQHAAAERIHYEEYLDDLVKGGESKIDLLVPLNIEVSNKEHIIILEHLDLIKSIGIDIEDFGKNTFIIRTHPSWIYEGEEKECIKKILEIISKEEVFSKEKFIERTAITMACRKSIKAHDFINIEEMQYLLDELIKCKNPFTCPHGRPTIITYTLYDLEKMFKRALD